MAVIKHKQIANTGVKTKNFPKMAIHQRLIYEKTVP